MRKLFRCNVENSYSDQNCSYRFKIANDEM